MAKKDVSPVFGEQNAVMTPKADDTRIVLNLLGATSVGKGYIQKQVCLYFKIAYGLIVDVIGTGDEIRKRFLTDPDFKEEWEPVVSSGDPLPDRIMIPMFDKMYYEGPNNGFLLVNDGFLRNTDQVIHAGELGLMGENSISVRLLASRKTCLDRAIHRAANKIGGLRVDAESFDKRFEADQKAADSIRACIIQKTKSQFIHTNANGNLGDVSCDVLSFVGCKIANLKIQLPNIKELKLPLLRPSAIPDAILV